jgi:hypothetical protein
MLAPAYSGGPLDLQGSTECTLENDPVATWSLRLEPPHTSKTGTRKLHSYTFDLNRVFQSGGRRWPAKFRVRDELTGRWELMAERIGPARY